MKRTIAVALFAVLLVASPSALAERPSAQQVGVSGKNALVVSKPKVFARLKEAQVNSLKQLITQCKKNDPKLMTHWNSFLVDARKRKTDHMVVQAALAVLVNGAMLSEPLRIALGYCDTPVVYQMAQGQATRLPACVAKKIKKQTASEKAKQDMLRGLTNRLKKLYELLSTMMKNFHDMQMKPIQNMR